MSEVTAVLERAWERIKDPKNWCKGELATNQIGIRVHPASPLACKFCAVGSVRARYSAVNDKAEEALAKAAKEMGQAWTEDVNDRLGHEAVRQMYARAIEISKAEGR